MKKNKDSLAKQQQSENQCFLFIGEDDFLVNREAEELVKQLLGKDDKTLSLETIDAFSKNAAEIAEAISQTIKSLSTVSSLLARKKIVWLRNAAFLGEDNLIKREIIKKSLQKLSDILSNGLLENHFLVITAPSVDKRIFFYKTLEDVAKIWIQPTPKPWETHQATVSLLKESFSQHQIIADNEAIELMAERIGYHPAIINNEIIKIATYLSSDANKKFLTKDIVERLVPSYTDTAIWDFVDAVSNRLLIKAISLLKNLFFKNEEPIAILTMLENRFRQLLIIKNALKNNKIKIVPKSSRFDNTLPFTGDKEYIETMLQLLSSEKGRILTPYILRKFAEETERFTFKELENAFEIILKTRRAIVSSNLSPKMHIELMTIAICA